YTLAGAHYGYALLWSIPFIVMALAVVQEMNTRMGVVTGKGLADLIREQLGVRVTFMALGVLVLANVANTISNFAGVAASMEIYGISRYFAVPLAAAFLSWVVVKGTYRFVERLFLVSCVLYLVYAISAFLADPPWASVLKAAVRPTFQIEQGYLVMLITVIGTTITPWMQFYLQSSIVDKGIRIKELPYARWDTYLGSLISGVMVFFIIVACAATLYVHGVRVETAEEAALAIEPFAGRFASSLFAFGLLNSSLAAAAIIPLSTAYAVCEGLGWETGVDRSFKDAPGFFSIYVVMLALGAGLILWPNAPLIPIMFFSQTLNGILLPFILLFMLRIVNDKEVMGPHGNTPLMNLVAWGTAFVLIVLTLLLLAAIFIP
ncbi:MAG: NRAMP family divalent metal transporter, partial [Candidatus Methylomirabilales bacterium]